MDNIEYFHKRRLNGPNGILEFRLRPCLQGATMRAGIMDICCVYQRRLNLAFMVVINGYFQSDDVHLDHADEKIFLLGREYLIAEHTNEIIEGSRAIYHRYFQEGPRRAALTFLLCMRRTRLIPRGVDVLIAKRVYASRMTCRDDWWRANEVALPTWNTVEAADNNTSL